MSNNAITSKIHLLRHVGISQELEINRHDMTYSPLPLLVTRSNHETTTSTCT